MSAPLNDRAPPAAPPPSPGRERYDGLVSRELHPSGIRRPCFVIVGTDVGGVNRPAGVSAFDIHSSPDEYQGKSC